MACNFLTKTNLLMNHSKRFRQVFVTFKPAFYGLLIAFKILFFLPSHLDLPIFPALSENNRDLKTLGSQMSDWPCTSDNMVFISKPLRNWKCFQTVQRGNGLKHLRWLLERLGVLGRAGWRPELGLVIWCFNGQSDGLSVQSAFATWWLWLQKISWEVLRV